MVRQFCLVALFAFLGTSTASALDAIPSRLLFTTRIEYPTRIVVCAGQLWVYERGSGQLASLARETGEVKKRHVLDFLEPFRQVTALACVKDQLLIAYDIAKKPARSRIRLVPADDTVPAIGDELPTVEINGRVQDLFCANRDCYVLSQGHLFLWHEVVPPDWPCVGDNCFYQSLVKLTKLNERSERPTLHEVQIPSRSTMRALDVNLGTNMYAEWGFQNAHAEGLYVAGDISPDNLMVLVDPFRTQVTRRAGGEVGWWGRWGRWGYGESRLLFPKEATILRDDRVAILDGVLRTISIFSDAGEYGGLITVGKQTPVLLWPSDLASWENIIYVADSQANAVIGIETPSSDKKFKPVKPQAISPNLYRRQGFVSDSENDRCQHCHDGMLSDNSRNFVRHSTGTHPIGVVPKMTGDLPLDKQGQVACKTCHEPHHGESFRNGEPAIERTRPFLRTAVPGLCGQCHDNQKRPHSHPMNSKVSCLSCHEVHGQVHGSVIRRTEQLCLECHKSQNAQHRAVDTLLDTDRARKLRFFEEGRISCGTCHAPHKGEAPHILASRTTVLQFCSSCHGPKAPKLYDNFHKLIKKKGVKWTH